MKASMLSLGLGSQPLSHSNSCGQYPWHASLPPISYARKVLINLNPCEPRKLAAAAIAGLPQEQEVIPAARLPAFKGLESI